jgi:hypothetical protein
VESANHLCLRDFFIGRAASAVGLQIADEHAPGDDTTRVAKLNGKNIESGCCDRSWQTRKDAAAVVGVGKLPQKFT